ncbi:hypothetical protein ACFXB3_11235 [Streptomyces sp. NPDC059447]|uniref:hypothetical protein n=1 Tax=Streptomyces sp. NPDC059447 TaxID=3346834 RepID=UPI003696B860
MLDQHALPAVQQSEQLLPVRGHAPVEQVPARQGLLRPAEPHVRLRHQDLPPHREERVPERARLEVAGGLQPGDHVRPRDRRPVLKGDSGMGGRDKGIEHVRLLKRGQAQPSSV